MDVQNEARSVNKVCAAGFVYFLSFIFVRFFEEEFPRERHPLRQVSTAEFVLTIKKSFETKSVKSTGIIRVS